MKKYKCMNIGNCDNANTGKEFEIAEGAKQECPVCHKEMLAEVKGSIVKPIGIIAAVVAVIGGGVGAFFGLKGANKPWPEQIVLDKTEITMTVGTTELLTPTAMPEDAKKKATFTFKVLNSSKAVTVNSGGLIKAVKVTKENEPVTISVKCEENPDLPGVKCKVNVVPPVDTTVTTDTTGKRVYVEQINPSKTSIELKVGEKEALTYSTVPAKTDEQVDISVKGEDIITFSATGEVVALKAGKATITFMANQSGTQAVVEITVKDSSTPPPPPQPSWGKYEGPRNSSGKPEGNGILRITRQHTINGETAQPGERIEGVFRDGYVNLGTWFKNDGNAVVVKGLKVI